MVSKQGLCAVDTPACMHAVCACRVSVVLDVGTHTHTCVCSVPVCTGGLFLSLPCVFQGSVWWLMHRTTTAVAASQQQQEAQGLCTDQTHTHCWRVWCVLALMVRLDSTAHNNACNCFMASCVWQHRATIHMCVLLALLLGTRRQSCLRCIVLVLPFGV